MASWPSIQDTPADERQTVPAAAEALRVVESGSRRLKHYRAIFLSDVHLGTRGCKSTALLQFLRHHRAPRLYLLGDIIDVWMTRKILGWPQAHTVILRRLLAAAGRGTELYYLPGNHDAVIRRLAGVDFGGIRVMRRLSHVTLQGHKLLLTHGDEFDRFVVRYEWIARAASHAYHWVNVFEERVNGFRVGLGRDPLAICRSVREHTKRITAYINGFEHLLAAESRQQGYDGVICGHMHRPTIRWLDGTLYCNAGDWVENCSALVENLDGSLELLRFGPNGHPATDCPSCIRYRWPGSEDA